ncbi:YhfT family protein [uncultured Traorella sp.]|uniref:YhfT family protein n=1 Tax=uncultured Traorella sp. TaxID=1929048 RepID=UPI0025EB8F07|nr:YhfT family protein [uncultured Traorella sp.]
MEGIITNFEFPMLARTVVLVMICAWASLLSHKCISNFNDGARPVFPELIEKRMSRAEFAVVITGMGFGWVLAGFSQWLGTGLIACHLTLIATDCLGAWSPNKWVALGIGAGYGLLCAFGTNVINQAFMALPYNFLNDLTNISTPTLPIFSMFPAVAIAGQFGARKGIGTGVIEAIVYILCTLVGTVTIGSINISLYPYTFAMLAGMICLIVFAAKGSSNSESVETDAEEENLFSKNADRIKSNWKYLCVQGALNALGIKILAQAYQPYILSAAVLSNDMTPFYIAMVGVIIAFIPLIVSTSLATGVYQAVGLCSVMLFGVLAPTWWLAPILGFAAEFVEIQLIGLLGKLLSKFPELSKCGDHIRDGMISTIGLALTIGAFLAANATWGEVGIMLVGAFYVVNEVTGQRLPKSAVGPIAAVAVGIIYNIVVALGFIVI